MLKSIDESGKIKRAFVGIQYIPLNSDLAKTYNLSLQT
jgi:S1-C subfamily serine protease